MFLESITISHKTSYIKKHFNYIIPFAFSTNGPKVKHHKPIGFALKILTNEGVLIGQYQSLLQITGRKWNKSDKYTLKTHQINFKTLKSDGRNHLKVIKQIFLLFNRLGITEENSCFITFNSDFQEYYLQKMLRNPPKENYLDYLLSREIGVKKLIYRFPSPFHVKIFEFGFLNRRNFNKPLSRNQYLLQLNLPSKSTRYDHCDVVNEVHLAWLKINYRSWEAMVAFHQPLLSHHRKFVPLDREDA